MDRTHPSTWSDETATNGIPSRWPWNPRTENTPTFTPQQINDANGIELTRIGGYAMVIALLAVCMLLNAWSRIDLRETAVALDKAERRHTAERAESMRLNLELATLEDPAWLAGAATALELDETVSVIELNTTASR